MDFPKCTILIKKYTHKKISVKNIFYYRGASGGDGGLKGKIKIWKMSKCSKEM